MQPEFCPELEENSYKFFRTQTPLFSSLSYLTMMKCPRLQFPSGLPHIAYSDFLHHFVEFHTPTRLDFQIQEPLSLSKTIEQTSSLGIVVQPTWLPWSGS